jgi:hypothetical protein
MKFTKTDCVGQYLRVGKEYTQESRGVFYEKDWRLFVEDHAKLRVEWQVYMQVTKQIEISQINPTRNKIKQVILR